jgi:hypothetical protein
LDADATVEGWYYDAAHGVVLVKILPTSRHTEVAVAIESIELQTLEASLATNASAVVSEGNIRLSVNVTHTGVPIQNAFVQLSSDLGGTFAPSSGYTAADGSFNVIFTAPNVTVQTTVRISASVSKLGFVTDAAYKDVAVVPPGANPPTLLSISLYLTPQVMRSGEGCLIDINVTDGTGSPVVDVRITLASNQSSDFFPSSGHTSSQGSFSSLFAAPNVTQQTSCMIIISASKSGYLSTQNETLVTVFPRLPDNGLFDYMLFYYLAIAGVLGITSATLIVMVLRRRKVPVVVQRF